ncbi:cell division protein FtsZ [Acidithiobacillus sp. CV18-2]|uniref:Cell division protein FtsZ n=1 Tax=Igneacidithiobacillus copahuensis TaxID=2724909 RepID=A0AAE2YPV1_9PROT|nr:cell division protein FtsZ [Igneacidithiobacillus copahuensis]MBU2755512.1 cell division protein FtsZ [Acidithiobacillus sp. CV18-3]MBU2757817.1 cell division protein FtsZ [Acidithiobacillus sp. BN09-2]MBU2777918.1 cell division protein FtsZ [Acidithiobacillus sp. CV18-2]MBU2797844.1 cell division protein FtsZ [Acidithiobacillus sp. VAN18-2]MBU2799310.1 cell division protein FtsZ [Acidithiobacillus sp. VAN18-4]UTV80632.1 cell division protein FtsZ [Acidithiobacillus sp. YTS05]
MFELNEMQQEGAVIKVIGVGGGGGNAINNMALTGLEGVEFISANTDAQALRNSHAQRTLQLGSELTRGLGAGANPEIGRKAAEECREEIRGVLENTDMLFITTGMGGGTGTGAAPVVASIARDMGILTVGVVTKPFNFEGKKRQQYALSGIDELAQHVDSLVIIPNEKLLAVLGKQISLRDAYLAADNVLMGAVQGISELITRPGLMNLDFADVRTVMSGMGLAMMGTAAARGESRARDAANRAASSPLLDDINLSGARGILVNITAGNDLSLGEFEEVGELIRSYASDDANVKVGTVIDENLEGEMRVTVVATGLQREPVRLAVENNRLRPEVTTPANAVDWRQLDRPAALRQQATRSAATSTDQRSAPRPVADYADLDIPAFLRRQAD